MAEKSNFMKLLDNYWYHYKWHTIIALFLVVTVGVSVTQCAVKPNYDQSAVLYCDRTVMENTALALEMELTKHSDDLNGDGETLFGVYNVSYDSDGTNPQNAAYANSQKLMVMVSSADYVLYIVDEYGYKRLMTEDNMQLFETYDFLPDKEGTAWNWKGSALQETMKDSKLPENLYFCIRKVAGTAAQGDEDAIKRAEHAAELLQNLIKDVEK
ncbi:MAG: hypothetical protein IKM39_03115 [Clostridia bacterium]|nr:hypothetical protein [Clostridia bacterium]